MKERGRRDIFTHVEEEAASVTCSVSVYGILVQNEGVRVRYCDIFYISIRNSSSDEGVRVRY